MPRTRVRVTATDGGGAALRDRFAAVRRELGVPDGYPAAAVAEADRAAAALRLPDLDATDVALVTIDPPGSTDLDQAMQLERRGSGYRVRYAIADLGSFVPPGGPLDAEAHARGETLYSPDLRTPLHPPRIAEGAASLLPGQVRPALLWTLDLDDTGELTAVDLRRARVRSRERLDYAGVQGRLDAGLAPEWLLLLREVGRLREQRAEARGAVDLGTPEQEVVAGHPDGWTLTYRGELPVERWNAQISLLTGMAAARIMLDGTVGVLRTLPPPDPTAVASLRRSALALGVSWPEGVDYAEVLRGLEPMCPPHAAVLRLATVLLRGAAYVAFDGTLPDQRTHSAVAASYAHATAPLRRLVDRYVGETCLALCAGTPPPEWVRRGLPALPERMAAADHRGHTLDRAMVDLVEATLLHARVDEVFPAMVVEAGEERGEVQLRDPAVRATCEGAGLPLGEDLEVRLVAADPDRRRVLFRPA